MRRFNEREFIQNSKGYEKLDVSVSGIEVYINKEIISAYYFGGKRSKPDWKYRFKTELHMLQYIDKKVKDTYDRNKAKEARKVEDAKKAKEARANVKVGDIFATSWGYEQTNVDFFQVTERLSATYVMVRQIQKETAEETSWCSANVKCVKNSFIGEPKKCQINKYGDIVKADRYGNNASKTSVDATHYTSWGY